jgi:hypothetical protein
LPSSKELENLGKAIAEIGKGRSCFTVQTIKEVKKALFRKATREPSFMEHSLQKGTNLPNCFEC